MARQQGIAAGLYSRDAATAAGLREVEEANAAPWAEMVTAAVAGA